MNIRIHANRACRYPLLAGAALAALALAGCGSAGASATRTAAPKATVSTSQTPASTPAPSGSSIPVLHLSQTAALPASAQNAGTDETWTLNSASYISYAQSQEGQADETDVAQQLGANEPQPASQFVVLGITVKNTGTAADSSLVITNGTFEWVTKAGKVGQTNIYSVDSDPTGVLAPYASNAQPSSVNLLAPGQSVTGYVAFEVPDAPSVLVASSMLGGPAIVVDPLHMIAGNTCSATGGSCADPVTS